MSVQSMEEMGKDIGPNFLQPFLEKIDRRSLFQYFTTLSLGGGAHLRVPCRGALLGHMEWEGVANFQKTRKYLECGNQVTPKS